MGRVHVVLGLLVLATSCGAATVRTSIGDVLGTTDPLTGVRVFHAVPYAAPPRRWTHSSPLAAFKHGLVNQSSTPACAQKRGESLLGAEDCLSMAIQAPPAPPSSLPVMVFVHGGEGTAAQYSNSTALAAKGVVYVAVNYRLGALGFLATAALTSEADGASGNYGLGDLITALQFIQKHAGAFGGDPSRVTVFGQSSGAGLVSHLLVSPAAQGLFHAAIIQSHTWSLNSTPTLAATEAAVGEPFMQALGCHTLVCARKASTEAVLAAFPPGAPELVVGGSKGLLPGQLLEQIRSRTHIAVPVIVGRNVDESRLWDFLSGRSFESFADEYSNLTTLEQATEAVVQGTGYQGDLRAAAQSILRTYRSGTGYDRYTALASDAMFGCAAWALAAELQAAGYAVWSYVYGYTPAGLEPWGGIHGAELTYLLNDTSILQQHVMDAQELALTARLQHSWVHLAQHGTPGAAWPRYDDAQKRYLSIQGRGTAAFAIGKDFRAEQRLAWSQLWGYTLPVGVGQCTAQSAPMYQQSCTQAHGTGWCCDPAHLDLEGQCGGYPNQKTCYYECPSKGWNPKTRDCIY